MVATVMKDSKPMAGVEAEAAAVKVTGGSQGGDVEFAKCECCGLTEECTKAYISRVRERYQGRWICGLCAEAVKDDILRFGTDEALNRHLNFCKKFRSSSPPPNPTEDLISAVKQLLLRSIDSPRARPMRKRGSMLAAPTSSPPSSSAASSLFRSKSSRSALDR